MSVLNRFKSWLDAGSSSARASFVEMLEERRLMSITLSGSVGNGGTNIASDVREVQQRLRDLNFRSKGGGSIVVDGIVGPATISAIQLYQAAIDPQGDGDPDDKDGRVDVNGETHKWLNATNSPRWVKLVDPDGAGGAFDIYRGTAQEEVWGTNWSVDMIKEACAASGGTEIITAISTIDGFGSAAWHATHQAGMDSDVNIDAAGRVVGSGALTTGEQRVIDDMKAFRNAAAPAFVTNIWVGYSRIVNGFNSQTGTTLAHLDSSNVHDTHFHVDLKPATRSATVFASAARTSSTSTLSVASTSKEVFGSNKKDLV